MNNSSVNLPSLFECNSQNGLLFKEEFKNNFITYGININHIEIDQICKLVIECQTGLLLKKINDEYIINDNDINQGFLVFHWSFDKLKELLSSTFKSVLICTIDKNKNKLIAYLLFTSIDNFIKHTDPKFGQLELDKNIITDEQWKQLISSSHIDYIKQIGVDKEYHGLGIASHLITVTKKQANQHLCTLILFWPYCNQASENCFTKNGFHPIGVWNCTNSAELFPFKAKLCIWPLLQETS